MRGAAPTLTLRGTVPDRLSVFQRLFRGPARNATESPLTASASGPGPHPSTDPRSATRAKRGCRLRTPPALPGRPPAFDGILTAYVGISVEGFGVPMASRSPEAENMDLMEALRSKWPLWLEAQHAAAEANTPAALMAVCEAEVDELADGQAPEAAPDGVQAPAEG